MNDLFMLQGKVVLVTGGGTGLGYAIAKCFANRLAHVVITGRREEVLENACRTLGGNSAYYKMDLSNLPEIPKFVEEVEKQSGSIDILVNNAGIHLKKEMLDVSDEEFRDIILVNQQSVFALSRCVAKRMVLRRRGSIIMISSMASQYGIPKVIAYTASKSAVEGMTRAMAVELSPMGIRVNCIAPGFIKTEMSAKAMDGDPERKAKILGRTPMQSFGDPEDIGNAAVFLASAAAKYINGVVLPVDGGNSIGF